MEKSVVENAVNQVEKNGPLKNAMAVYTAVAEILNVSPQYVGTLIAKHEIVMQTKPAGRGRPKNSETKKKNSSEPDPMVVAIVEKVVAHIPDEKQDLADLFQECVIPGVTGKTVLQHVVDMVRTPENDILLSTILPSEDEESKVA